MTVGHEDRLQHRPTEGVLVDGDTRYLMLRADSLMQSFSGLPPPVLQQVMRGMADSVYRNGMKSLRKYAAERGAGEPLTPVVVAMAGRLGWGRWQFDIGSARAEVTVHDSPFAHGFGTAAQPVCACISGMFRAVSELLLSTPTRVEESCCLACGAAHCRFIATAAASHPELF